VSGEGGPGRRLPCGELVDHKCQLILLLPQLHNLHSTQHGHSTASTVRAGIAVGMTLRKLLGHVLPGHVLTCTHTSKCDGYQCT